MHPQLCGSEAGCCGELKYIRISPEGFYGIILGASGRPKLIHRETRYIYEKGH